MKEAIKIVITSQSGMINIDSDLFAYSNIKDMYTIGNGVGIQVNEDVDKDKWLKFCNDVSERLYKLIQAP